MSKETAYKALEFLFDRSEDSDMVIITFYGGEPLLEFELLMEVVANAKEMFEGRELYFSMTTNGSLLTLDVAEFFVNNNISIMVSLDGMPKTHDRARRFASSGLGTYESIMENLRIIKDAYPDYYSSRITFNIVVDQRFSTDKMHSYFSGNEMFEGNGVSVTMINDGETGYEVHSISDEYLISEKKHRFYALLNKYNRPNIVSRISKEALQSEIVRIEGSLIASDMLAQETPHSGPCVPGTKLLVDVDGSIFPCERVSETSQAFMIGTLDGGFDIKKCNDLLNICRLTEEECKDCWAIRNCKICAKLCDNNGYLCSELKKSKCGGVRFGVESDFRLHLSLRELKSRI